MTNHLQKVKENLLAQSKQAMRSIKELEPRIVDISVKKGKLLSMKDLSKLDSNPGECFKHLITIYNDVAWSFSKRLYKIDEDLIPVLVNTVLDVESIDVSIINRLPDFGTAVYCPMTIEDVNILGFVLGVSGDSSSEKQLHITILMLKGKKYREISSWLSLSMGLNGILKSYTTVTNMSGEVYDTPEFRRAVIGYIFSIMMYLCSENVNSTHNGTVSPATTNIKHSNKGKFILPKVASIVPIGTKDGDTIRKFNGSLLADATRTVAPHIRRAHWHTYWVGSGDTRMQVLRFIPTTFINVDKKLHS